ncbi:MAG: DUF3833 family protein [Bosea sp. (in: a-proteobacteria)]
MKPVRNAAIAAFTAISATLTGGCATVPATGTQLAPKGVALERDFLGRSYAKGVFTNRITGSARAFTVVLNGKWSGNALTLREDFVYADGEKDVKTWVFRRLTPSQWTGTREDVVGEADVKVENGVVRISYDIDLPTSSGAVRLRFEDVIERNAAGMIVNRAIVSKFGLPLGDVDLTFSRKPL